MLGYIAHTHIYSVYTHISQRSSAGMWYRHKGRHPSSQCVQYITDCKQCSLAAGTVRPRSSRQVTVLYITQRRGDISPTDGETPANAYLRTELRTLD